jgi:trimeric autotransporter adhesin
VDILAKRSTTMLLRAILTLSLLTLLALAPGAHAADFGSTPESGLIADGPVEAIASSGENVYLGGSFTTIGPRTGQGVLFNSDLSARDTAIPQVSGGSGQVNVVIPDGAGGWYVGGNFTEVGGLARSDLAHILANDTVDPSFTPNPDGNVQELSLSGSTLVVVGQFETIGGQERRGFAAVETATGAATAFDPKSNDDEGLCGLATDGEYVFVCGDYFSEIGGQARRGLAQLHLSDGSATTWEPGNESIPYSMYLSPSKVLYLSYYGKFKGDASKTSYEGIAALQIPADPEEAPTYLPFHPNVGSVYAFYQIGSTLYIGGYFNSVAYAPADRETENFTIYERSDTAAFDIEKNYELLPFEVHVNNSVTELAGNADTLYVGGYFGAIGSDPRTNLSAVDPLTGEPTGSNPDVDGSVRAIAAAGSSLYVGGTFVTVGGSTRDHIAALNSSTGALEAFDPGLDGSVDALAIAGSTLYAGGSFRNATGAGEESHSRSNLAAFSTSDGTLTSFAPEPNGTVSALAVSGQTLFAGGSFNQLHEVAHGSLAAFSTTDGSTEAFDPSPNGAVHALSVSSGRLYAAGSFSELSGLTGTPARSDLAAFELPGETLDSSFVPPSFDGTLFAVAANGSAVYAGGDFNEVGSVYQPRLAALSAANGSLESWNPAVSDDVNALLLDGSTLYAGGTFDDAGGQARPDVAGLSTITGQATSFDPEPNDPVGALGLTANGLYIGGSFTAVGTTGQSYFAAFPAKSVTEKEAEEEAEAERERSEAGTGLGSGKISEGSDAGSASLSSTPVTFLTGGPSYYTTTRAETFTFVSDIAGASFRCSLDGAPAVTCTSPYKTRTLALGKHRFVVRAVMPSGLADVAGASESFVIEAAVPTTTAPAIDKLEVAATVTRSSSTSHKGRRATFTFSLRKAATVTIKLQRVERVACGHHRTCTRLIASGELTIHAHAGVNRVYFSGKVGKRMLASGRYRATLVASAKGAFSSKARTVGFRLIAAR